MKAFWFEKGFFLCWGLIYQYTGFTRRSRERQFRKGKKERKVFEYHAYRKYRKGERKSFAKIMNDGRMCKGINVQRLAMYRPFMIVRAMEESPLP